MTREDIKTLIPHRDGMLLLDEVVVENGVAIGKKLIKGDEWFLQGHFPDNPVVPGVILCEILAQSGCVLLPEDKIKGHTPFFASMNNVRFKGMVKPGDLFRTQCVLTNEKYPFVFASGKGYVDGKLCVSVDFSFALL